MVLSTSERQAKLATLAELEGFDDPAALIEAVIHDSVCPGICIREGCDYTVEIEPDQDRGWCEECRFQTVQSALILAGLI